MEMVTSEAQRWEYCSLRWAHVREDRELSWTTHCVSYTSCGPKAHSLFQQTQPLFPNPLDLTGEEKSTQSDLRELLKAAPPEFCDRHSAKLRAAHEEYRKIVGATIAELGAQSWEAISGNPGTEWIEYESGFVFFKRRL